ncbi:unnamed protein product, partial [Prorocentrum cordatum]
RPRPWGWGSLKRCPHPPGKRRLRRPVGPPRRGGGGRHRGVAAGRAAGGGPGILHDFLYPGHSRMRMVGPPAGYGQRLQQDLYTAVARQPRIAVRHEAGVLGLATSAGGRVRGVRLAGGEVLEGACVVLATNGFGANKAMVREHLGSSVANGVYLGSPLNTGEALAWAAQLGAATERMGAFQGHASVVAPSGPLVTWGVVVNGAILVNTEGRRFGNELVGYSAYSRSVMAQPGAEAVEVFPEACLAACRGTRFEEVLEAGAMGTFGSVEELCSAHGLPPERLAAAVDEVRRAAGGADGFGRPWPRESPFGGVPGALHAVRVRAALFHTQGGLRCDASQRVLRADGSPIGGLFAAGGTAAGLSGHDALGYLSGNGLLHAVVSGRWAGRAAAGVWCDGVPAPSL